MATARIALHRLTFVDEGDEVLVGRPDIESYAVLPADGAELIRRLQSGATLDEAARWYQATYGEELDIDDFVASLEDLGFVRRPGESEPDGAGRPVGLQRLSTALFSAPASVVYGVVVAAAVWAMVRAPQLRPSAHHVFFTHSLVVVLLVMIAVELPLLCLHEAAHVLAGRRLGLASRLSIGHRLYFVVFQTTLTGIYSVPRRRRYLPFLAGMGCDVLVFCGLVLLAAALRGPDGTPSVVGRAGLAAAYFTAIRFVWQFLFIVETDVHHVLATALRCTDLSGLTRALLRARFGRLVGRPAPDPVCSPRERAVLRWFAPLTAVGSVAVVTVAAVTVTPVVVGYATRIAEGIGSGTTTGHFWDTVVSLSLFVSQFGVLAVLLVRERLLPRRRAARAARTGDLTSTGGSA